MATPQVPPRPIRSQNLPASSLSVDMPRIPPRPKAKRSAERSVSPNRDTFARSPLNDPKFLHNGFKPPKATAAGESIRRPPSVTLPSLGQEGIEYANISTEDLSPEHTKNVAGDLPLHQPKASVPASTAKSRIQTVTRTDSSQAAAAGIGKLIAESDKGRTSSAQSQSSVGTNTRPNSIYKDDEEHGIPEIGVQVPMYPNAGDVQAPTPSQNSVPPATGVGFFNNVGQASGRQHVRTKSGRQIFCGPPGSYGMHGHGVIPQHQLEKSWYDKHPEDAAREMQGEYGPAIQDNRKEWHLSKEDLNKIVHGSAGKGIGMGTSREAVSTPDEQIGYLASEEYASRLASPRPASSRPTSIHGGPPKQRSSSSQTHPESPLRNMNFPVNQVDGEDGKPAVSDQALESETEDDVIHIDPPSAPPSRAQGGGFEPPSDDGDADEEDGAPILASDELAKNPPAEFMQPAVTPEIERRGSGDFSNDIPAHLRKNGKNGNKGYQSAPPSLSRFSSADEQERIGTPLENVQEYEPLFPDSDEERRKKQKGPVGKAKRPDVARHHFPSQDVWEDTPSSLQLETTVESPEPEKAAEEDSAKAGENADEDDGDKTETEGEDQSSFLADETKRRPKKHLPAHLVGDASDRPGLAQRFPSQDIWEDAPAHVYQYTTVETPEPQEEQKADVPAKPVVPTRPQRSKPGVAEAKEVSPVEKKAPIVPERPKPQVPARPSKPAKRDVGDGAPLTQTISAGSTGSASDGASSTPKAKPAVPARPGGSKIAALKAGFMSDLNQKLGLGPQAPKPKEAEKEAEPEVVEVKAPLSDARKGRAKGPQRRKPAASPSPAAAAATSVSESKPVFTLSFAPTVTVFSISDDGALAVPTGTEIPLKSEVTKAVAPEPEVSEVAAPVPATSEDTSEAGQHDTKVTSPGASTEEAAAPVDEKASEEADATVDKDAVEPASVTPPSKPAEEVPAESEPAESEPAESKPVAVAT